MPKLSVEECRGRIRAVSPFVEMLGEYRGVDYKTEFKCHKHNEVFVSTPYYVFGGTSCKECYAEKMRKHFSLSQEEIVSQIKKINPYIEVVGKYVSKNEKLLIKCKRCNNEWEINPRSIERQGIMKCPVCSDGISYPNKFCRNVLRQLPVENLMTEKTFDWSERHVYDNYFEYKGKKYVLEADGAQHYKNGKFWKETAKELQGRDLIKDRMALKHGITMIRINCEQSNMGFIRNSIEESLLGAIFDLSNINWLSCHEDSLNSRVKEVCNDYRNGAKVMELTRMYEIDKATVRRYLKLGAEIGWCKYDSRAKRKGA